MKTSFNLLPQGNTPHSNAVPLTAKRCSSRRAFTLIELLVNIPRYIMDGFIKQQLVKEIHPGIFLQHHPDLYDLSFGVNTKFNDSEMKDLIL